MRHWHQWSHCDVSQLSFTSPPQLQSAEETNLIPTPRHHDDVRVDGRDGHLFWQREHGAFQFCLPSDFANDDEHYSPSFAEGVETPFAPTGLRPKCLSDHGSTIPSMFVLETLSSVQAEFLFPVEHVGGE
jgi:hypothetical protein